MDSVALLVVSNTLRLFCALATQVHPRRTRRVDGDALEWKINAVRASSIAVSRRGPLQQVIGDDS